MKTKNLFLATALVASLAACTNEEIVDMQQQNIANGRPTVDNVTLNFGMGADSRVIYDGGWKWNSTDVIGALLMDNVNADNFGDEDATWAEKYDLSEFIHTSYPFTYSDGAWSCNTKMLEGNYFFAHPWASYDGVRQVSHSLLAQKQTGITKDVRGKAYADNNLFIGYQRIVAGTQAQDVLEDVKMYPVLGAIQLQIKNTGTQDRHINKVVLSGTGLYSTLTFDPTFGETEKEDQFQSAMYLDIFEECEETFEGWTKAEKEAHILSVVTEGEVADGQNEGFVQVTIEGTEAERLLKAGAKNTAYVMVMANPVDDVDDLTLSIYTDEGVVTNIDLTEENDEITVSESNKKGTTAITSAVVEKIGPNTTNTIEVQIDDNSFTIPREMEIYTSEDLTQLIEWNANAVGKRTVKAELMKNVTLSEEAAEILATAKLITLNITGEAELTIAEEVPATFFDIKYNKNEDRVNAALDIDVKTVIEGTINVDENTEYLPTALEIAEGAELNINVDYMASSAIENNGTLKIADEVSVKSATITNYGLMVVGEEADVKAVVSNGGEDFEAELNNNGYMTNVDNKDGSVVTMGQGASLVGSSKNAGLVISAKDAIIDLAANTGMIEYKEGAVIEATGVVYQKINAAVTLVDDEDNESPVNALYIVGATVTINDNVDDFTTIILGEGAKLKVNKGKTLSIATLETVEVEEAEGYKAYTQGEGNINVDEVNVYEFTTLVNTGNIYVNTEFDNDGTVQNKGAVTVPYGSAAALNATDWDYNVAVDGSNPDADNRTAKQKAMQAAVADWAKYWEDYNNTNYFNGNPYDFTTFINRVKATGTTVSFAAHKTALVAAYYGTTDAKKDEAELKMFGANAADYEPAEFKEAVLIVLKGEANVNLNAAKKALIDDDATGLTYGQFKIALTAANEVFEDMAGVRNNIAAQAFATVKAAKGFDVAMALYAISTTDIQNAITATENGDNWMLESDDIVAVAELWAKYSSEFSNAKSFDTTTSTNNTRERLMDWFELIYTSKNQDQWSEAMKDHWAEIKVYKSFIEGLDERAYTANQISMASGVYNASALTSLIP